MNRKLPKKKLLTTRIDSQDAGSTSSIDYDLRISIYEFRFIDYRFIDYRFIDYKSIDYKSTNYKFTNYKSTNYKIYKLQI